MNLTHKGNIIINNELEIAPRSLLCNFESLASDNSGRTLDGVMHIYWVFNKIRKLEIELAPTTADILSQVFSRVQGQEYDITYWDVLENAQKTIRVYTSNGSVDCYSGIVRNGLYTGAKFNAIEIAGELNVNTRRGVTPTISNNGSLVISTLGVSTEFERSGNDLVYDDAPDGVTYEIIDKDLWQNEE
jgi:hypothetical protein